MKTYLKNILWLLAAMICITSCDQEEVTDVNTIITTDGKIPVRTEIIVDGVITRASSEAGYTTGDGLYDIGDDVTVTATANEGYELISFYDKKDPTKNLGSSHTLKAKVPTTFKAEFGRKHTITVTASPTEGGTVSGGGKYGYGKSCTISAIANAGYAFDGWYEGSTKISSETNYTFTVSSSRTITGKFVVLKYIAVGANGYIISPSKTRQVGTNNWNAITYGNGKYVAVGDHRGTATSTNGVNWTVKEFGAGVPTGTGIINTHWNGVTYSNGKFVMVGYRENDLSYIATSTDGINWTANAVGNKYIHWQSVVYGNGKFVVLGNDCSFGYSSDGTNWEYKYYGISLSPTEYSSVTYGNGKFVAVGTGGKISTSTDGVNWTTPISVDIFRLYSVVYGNGKFVAAGYGGRGNVAYSTDGTNWTVTGSNTMMIYSVAYSTDNKMFVAMGGDGYVTYSSDGANWSAPEQVKDESGNTFTTDLRAVYMLP